MIRLLVLALLIMPCAAAAQAPAITYRVAHVFPTRVDTPGSFTKALRERLAERGYVDGKNIQLRFFTQQAADANIDSVMARQKVVDEVLAWRPHVIAVNNEAATRLFQRATTKIPIVFSQLTDPQASGFIDSFARPGGNITGAVMVYDSLSVKRLEITRALLPTARRIVLLSDSRNGGIPSDTRRALQAAADRLGFVVAEFDVPQAEGGLCDVTAHVTKARPEAIIPWGSIDAPSNYRIKKPWGAQMYGECLVTIQRELRAPVVDDSLDTVAQGTALALGEDQNDAFRRAADLIARILSGADPATTPVDMQMHVRFHLNAGSLRDLGIALPESVRMQADKVIP
ncbi:MAG: ABC transporter substrate-binding protein [Burkholderiales bacterium]|nr:ABC transporter substrate-binding protein [Burkholderiales bacterium]